MKRAKQIMLYARETAITFYKIMGYKTIESAHTLFDSIKHVKMIKNINRE